MNRHLTLVLALGVLPLTSTAQVLIDPLESEPMVRIANQCATKRDVIDATRRVKNLAPATVISGNPDACATKQDVAEAIYLASAAPLSAEDIMKNIGKQLKDRPKYVLVPYPLPKPTGYPKGTLVLPTKN